MSIHRGVYNSIQQNILQLFERARSFDLQRYLTYILLSRKNRCVYGNSHLKRKTIRLYVYTNVCIHACICKEKSLENYTSN